MDKAEGASKEVEGIEKRRVERGSRIVVAVPSSMSLVLQMPRGNLETIDPRAMVMRVVRDDVDAWVHSSLITISLYSLSPSPCLLSLFPLYPLHRLPGELTRNPCDMAEGTIGKHSLPAGSIGST